PRRRSADRSLADRPGSPDCTACGHGDHTDGAALREEQTMSVFGSLMGKILGNSAHASEAKVNAARATAPAGPTTPAPSAPASTTATAAPPVVDVELVLETMAAGTPQ